MIYIYGVLAGFLTMFINYCIGKPASKEFSPYEIFSFYTVWLSIRRLKQVDLYDKYFEQYNQNMERAETKHQEITVINEFKKQFYNAAEPFFTWERAVGMCPVCTGFWISLFSGLVITTNFLELIQIILISHITIRILSKTIL